MVANRTFGILHAAHRLAAGRAQLVRFPLVLLSLVLALLVLVFQPAEGLAQEGKLPLPRFASLQSGEVNMRRGPGETYPIMWTYQRANLPVEIIEEFENWRRIRDHDGVVGWVKATLLTGKRHALVRDQRRSLRQEAEPGAAPVAYLDPGVVLRVLECAGEWCRLEVQGYE
ncbi:MAG: SH3 domain-containing protein, partial [Rhodospirillaceae bacterium]|nr:SH3 domain-containing protein [Rhodospirillaceae bacterium]